MNFPDACKILGLAPGDDPRPHLAEFQNARERISAMVDAAPNEILAGRYRKGLVEFDEALTAVQAHLAAVPAVPSVPSVAAIPAVPPAAPPAIPTFEIQALPVPSPPKTIFLGTVPAAPKSPTAEVLVSPEPAAPPTKPHRPGLSYAVWFLIVFFAAAGGGWWYLEHERSGKDHQLLQIAALERQGSSLVETRRWTEASESFAAIEKLDPGSEIAARGRRSIESGMMDEQTQFIGYWNGQAIAELESGRLDEAEAAARQVIAKYPGEKEATALLEKIAAARAGAVRTAAIDEIESDLEQRKFEAAVAKSQAILAKSPDDAEVKTLLASAQVGMEKAAADRAKAAELFASAAARDSGQFNQEALEMIREAKALDPSNAEIAALFEKLSGYTRTLRVPEDFATPAAALDAAHDRDRIVLAAGTWSGPLVVDVAVELQGAGVADTKIECAPDDGSVITLGPEAKGARISGISFRHKSFATGTDRFSVALVRGASVTFTDCHFTEASGHGLAIIEGGQVTVTRSRFEGNGWDGVAVIGAGSTLDMRESEALRNFEHGIESWEGGAVILVKNRCEGNSRNGIHSDNGPSSATLEGNQLIGNREFGLVLDSAGSGKVTGNTARDNLLGGMVIRAAAAKVACADNQITGNQGPGLTLEAGLTPANYARNSVSQNQGQQFLSADLSEKAPAAPVSPITPTPTPTPKPAVPAPSPEAIPRAKIVAEPPPRER